MSRHSTLLAGVAIIATMASQPALAQVKAFDIPAQPVTAAVKMFGQQADVQILAARKSTSGKMTKAVRGNATIHEGLRRLLDGTGLTARKTGAQTYTIVPLQGAASPTNAAMMGVSYASVAQNSIGASEVPGSQAADAGAADIIVTGVRASINSAARIKQNASTIVDSIVAEDIGKLPDNNVAEALQRITGVQITRSQGEGSGVSIRGLTQVQTLLNGRNVFTATGRGISFTELSAELIAGADVYKTPTADLIEGGLGGTIDLRTRRPFDFKKPTVSVSVRGAYADLADEWKPEVSMLMTDKWETGIGELGVLVTATMQKRSYRGESTIGGSQAARSDAYDANGNGFLGSGTTVEAGDSVIVPGAGGLTYTLGDRTRWGLNGIVQWRPTDTLEVFIEGNYSRFLDKNDSWGLFSNHRAPSLLLNPVFDENKEFVSGTWTPSRLDIYSATSRSLSETYQVAGRALWDPTDRLHVSTDIAYTKSKSNSTFFQNALEATAPTEFQSYAGAFPIQNYGSFDLTNPNNLRFNRVNYQFNEDKGDEKTGQIDGRYEFDGILKAIRVGYRYADRAASSGAVSRNTSLGGRPVSSVPGLVTTIPVSGLFDKKDSDSGIQQIWATPDIEALRNRDALRQRFGLPVGDPALTPLTTYDLTEKTNAIYGRADFGSDIGTVAVSGNIGVRYVKTKTSVDGFASQPNGTVTPLSRESSYDNWLPSFNLRVEPVKGLVTRFAASKVLSRPGFSSLSPALNLNYLFLTGSSGNPDLRPLTSKQLDATLEYYFGRSNSIYAAGFYKKVDGFISRRTFIEQYGGQSFEVQRPINGDDGKIKGFEIGWNQFLDFLPAPFDGLGFQANYTYVDSQAPGPIVGQTVPLEGLSKHSYNLIGIYEKGPVSLRVAYNYRGSYVETTAGPGSGSLPLYRNGFGILDGSLNLEVAKGITLTLDAANITRPIRYTYYGLKSRPNNNSIEDRRFEAGVRFAF